MKITSAIYNKLQLNSYIEYIDSALLMTKEYSLVYDDLNLDEAIKICLNNNVMPIISINKIITPNDTKLVYSLLEKYKDNSNIYFYVTDLGCARIGINLNIINRMIFNPETMIANTLDLIEYASLGFDALAMSHEITLEDFIKSYNETKLDLFYLGLGHRLMFYSKRKLISLYEAKNNTKYPKENLYLREATRKDYLPIIENDNGTVIYRSYIISLVNEIDELSFLKYFLCDPLYIDSTSYLNALKAISNYHKNKIAKNEMLDIINNLHFNIEDGFKYNDSVYQKEELKK